MKLEKTVRYENQRLKELNVEKHELLRHYEKHLIKEDDFKKRFEELEIKIRKEIDKEIVQMNKEQIIKNIKQEELEMAKEEKEVKGDEIKKRGKKEQANSYASIAAKVLAMKGIKNMDDAVAKVDELKPGMDKDKIKGRINAVIAEVKKQKQARWMRYTWDKENFLLTEK